MVSTSSRPIPSNCILRKLSHNEKLPRLGGSSGWVWSFVSGFVVADTLFGYVVDRVLDGDDFLRVFVRDLDALAFLTELFFERHDQLDEVQGVGVEVVNKRRLGGDFGLFDAELFGYDFSHSIENAGHRIPP